MPRSGSLPYLVLAAILAAATAIFLVDVLLDPVANQFMALDGWRGSDLQYANDGMRMIGQMVQYILLIIIFGIGFGVLIDARRSI